MGGKRARRRQVFAGRGAGDAADERQKLAVVRHKAQHGIAVFLILENDGQDRTDDGRFFSHVCLLK